jgi:LPXTG-motif cell wall-anchored protein
VKRPIAAVLAVAALTCYRLVEPHRLFAYFTDAGDWFPLVGALALTGAAVYLWRKS